MNDLVKLLTSQLGITEQQANGGTGALMKLAQEKLGGDWSTLAQAVPGIEQFISHAPAVDSTSGIGGMLGTALNAFGMQNTGLANMAQLVTQFQTLKLDADMVTKFTPIVMQFVQQKGGPVAAELIQKVLKG